MQPQTSRKEYIMSTFNHITDLNNYGVNYNSTITLPCGETIMLNPFIYAKYLKFANAAKANANKRNDKNELALIHPITKEVYIPTMIKGVYLKAVCNAITDVLSMKSWIARTIDCIRQKHWM